MNDIYRKLGEILVAHKAITKTQLNTALKLQVATGRRLGQVLVESGCVDELTIADCLAQQYGYELIDPDSVTPSANALKSVAVKEALTRLVLPVVSDELGAYCLIADPLDVPLIDQLSKQFGGRVRFAVAAESKLVAAIRRHYGISADSKEFSLPSRYAEVIVREKSGAAIWLDAIDSYLDRPVTLFGVPFEAASEVNQVKLVKAAARANSPRISRVFDTFESSNYRWTVIEALTGDSLAHLLQLKGKRSASEAAEIIYAVAEGAEELRKHGANSEWITAENVWMDRKSLVVCPVFSAVRQAPPTSSDVTAIGFLLYQCLSGKQFEGPIERKAWEAFPAGMKLIIEHCLTQSKRDKYSGPLEVARALTSYKWSNERPAVNAASERERTELLSTLHVVSAPKPKSMWERLLGRKAA